MSSSSIPKEWVRDKRSPFIHDQDFHSPQYYAFEGTPKRVSPELHVSSEFESKDLEEEQLHEITGLPSSKPLHVRRKAAENAIAYRRFEQAQKAPKLLKEWRDRDTMERHKANLSEDIMNHLAGETRYVQKARYAYLSSKVAKQRALSEASHQVLESAEVQRMDLYQRQVVFQRLVTKARAVVNFPSQMTRLRLLSPADAHPEPVSSKKRAPVRVVSVDVKSSANISNLLRERSEKPPTPSPDQHYYAAKIQARFRCYIAHKRVSAMKIVVRFLKKNYRLRKLRRVAMKAIAVSRKRSRRLLNLFNRLRDDPDMQAGLKALSRLATRRLKR